MLPREERLVRRRDFASVYARKKSWVTPLLVLYVRRFEAVGQNSETRRFGFSVSKKVGKAHERNRIKRRLREICRSLRQQLRIGFDAVFVVRTAAGEADFGQLTAAVRELFRKAGLILPAKTETALRPGKSDATPARNDGSFPAEPGSDKG